MSLFSLHFKKEESFLKINFVKIQYVYTVTFYTFSRVNKY